MQNSAKMSAQAAPPETTGRLEQIVERLHNEVLRLTEVSTAPEAAQQVTALRQEIDGMATLIAETRSEVAGLMPSGLSHSRLTSASDDLDAVVDATERAAVEIMNAAEQVQEAAQQLRLQVDAGPDVVRNIDALDVAVMDIFLACSFQDLTGQRIRKVVQALTYIEKRVLSLTQLWQHVADLEPHEAPAHDTRADAHLLNGPSRVGLVQDDIDFILHGRPDIEASQNEIDALFA